ncbi:MAG: NAD-dependent epimerase/dehydratase family protein [Actinomycetes bacterium]
MSSRLRSRRTTVGITGATQLVPSLLAQRLAARPDVQVVALDSQRGSLTGVTWRVADVLDPSLAAKLQRLDVLVHVVGPEQPDAGIEERRAATVRAAQTVITCAAAARVPRLVLVTSAMVYGARADNAVPLAEDAPLRAPADESFVGDLVEVERLAARAPEIHPGLSITVVRPAALVGPGVDGVVPRHFEAPRLVRLRGVDQRWQFCHVDDLASALELAALETVTGHVAVGCDGWLEQADVERVSDMRSVELSPALAFATAERLHRVGVLPTAATDLAFVVSPWVVDCAALRAAGWRPERDNEACLRLLLAEVEGRHAVAGRRVGRRDATTLGAAGAAVAVLGTAAIVRRTRRARRLR